MRKCLKNNNKTGGLVNVTVKCMKEFTAEEKSYIDGVELSSLPKHTASVVIAMGQYNRGKEITTKCPYCNSPISIEGKGNPVSAWVHSCGCGKCNGTFRGL